MPTLYQTPGVYINELTGPGVIQGVGTSTAVFIGPAVVGPISKPTFVTSFDDYKRIFGTLPNGQLALYITSPQRFYLTDAVSGFFQNGGTQAYIFRVVRVGTGKQATWTVTNQAATHEPVFVVQAIALGRAGNGTVATSASSLTPAPGVQLAFNSTPINDVQGNGTVLIVADASSFKPGDIVTVGQPTTAVVAKVDGNTNTITLRAAFPSPGAAKGQKLDHADITTTTATLRLKNASDAQYLFAGSVVQINGKDAGGNQVQDYAVIQAVDPTLGLLTLAPTPIRTNTFHLPPPGAVPTLISQEFTLTVTPPGGSPVSYANLSLNPSHPNYVMTAVPPALVQILPPDSPPATNIYPGALVQNQSPVPPTTTGVDDAPGKLALADYQAALDQLLDLEGVNIVCIPDAASHPTDAIPIQKAMIEHCTDPSTLDRVAVLDSQPGLPPGPGTGSVMEQRGQLDSPSGYAALYYPWLTVPDLAAPPNVSRRINIPPCGHIAGIYAQTDAKFGVHKAPANVEVAGVVGLETILSDRQQGPLNNNPGGVPPGGVNVLRIFPGSGAVNVWGARTTVNTFVQGTDWVYISTRRLLNYIEQSLKQFLRLSVFQPNNPTLWGALTREIEEFLTRVWQTGALFGTKASEAFYVRIDAGNNPPSLQALGQLNIEAGVRVSYPAEFIIVTIGLWDGGAKISEQ